MPSMDPLATPAQLATRLGTATQAEADAGSPDVLDTSRAYDALTGASGAIRAACGWPVSRVTGATATVTNWQSDVVLPTMHLTAVAVTAAGVPLVYGTDFVWDEAGTVKLSASLQRYSGWTATPLQITYTHGYLPVPDEVIDTCLDLAVDRYENPERLRQKTRDLIINSYAVPADPAWLKKDPRLAPYVRLAVA